MTRALPIPASIDDRHRPIAEPTTEAERVLRDQVLYCAADIEYASRAIDSRDVPASEWRRMVSDLAKASRAWERARTLAERRLEALAARSGSSVPFPG